MKHFLTFTLLIFSFISFSYTQTNNNVIELQLHENWKFKQTDAENWLTAKVPGCVHTDLLDNEKIKDPFYGVNELDLQWIDKYDWEYQTTFKVEKDLLDKDHIELVFDGLDTYADVHLNDRLILIADNMFRSWPVYCKDFLVEGENTLRIVLKSPIRIGLKKHAQTPYTIPVSDNDQSESGGLGDKKVSIFTRKAGYHFGWDWGPRFVTSGIWRPVTLHAWDKAIIRDVYLQQAQLTDDEAKINAQIEIDSKDFKKCAVRFALNGEDWHNEDLELNPGKNIFNIPLTITNPKRWWSNGLGDAYLYNVKTVLEFDGNFVSEKTEKIGLRTIEIIQEPDEKGEGKSFYFKVNGHPVFMKGANYIPQDNFLNRVTKEKYEHVIQSAVDANMNMLRIWGGGIYENDIFYDLCDEKGILVWQDFMFACAMFPGDPQFLNNVRQEAKQNVIRLRNHPSIALWCGNNENLSAWHRWGWKQQVARDQSPEIAATIWKAYEDVFHDILPEAVEKYDPVKFYWASSPQAAEGEPENYTAGDTHYWGVWWGQEPFVNYRKKISRFMSEYGFQSFPELSTVKKYSEEKDWDIFSEVMKAHQRSSIGNGTIANYMDRNYKKPKDFPSFLYVGHLLQAEGIKVAMEGHRKKMPYCMGSLYWQIDDCWPVASWSSMDYYGNWKAQQYFAKKAFEEYLISPETDGEKVEVYIVSDNLEEAQAEMKLNLMDFSGKSLWKKEQTVTVSANQSKVYFEIPESELTGKGKKEQLLLYCSIEKGGKVLSENILYFLPAKDLELPKPEITMEVEGSSDGFKITVSSDKLAKNIYFTIDEVDGFFSDNYFDLLPGEKRTITFVPNDNISNKKLAFKAVSLVDTF